MGVELLVGAIGVSAGVLALWFDMRFRAAAPRRVAFVFAHLVASCVVGKVILPPAMNLLDSAFVAIFVAILPSLVYMCLSVIWTIRLAQRALGGGGGGGLTHEAR